MTDAEIVLLIVAGFVVVMGILVALILGADGGGGF